MRHAFNRVELKTRLLEEFGEAGDYSPFPRADWKDEVNNGTTHVGYWDWVVVQEQKHIIETRNNRILRLAREGIHPNVIAEAVGVAKATVFRVRRDAGDTALMQYRRGTEAEKLQAKQLLEDGASYWEVGRTIGFSGSSVSRWFPGYSWSAQQRSESSAMSRKLNQLERLTLAEKV
jgi:transposase-like protein